MDKIKIKVDTLNKILAVLELMSWKSVNGIMNELMVDINEHNTANSNGQALVAGTNGNDPPK